MAEQQIPIKRNFSDYLYIILKWKKFLFINLFIIVLLTAGLTFLIPKTYKSTATVMVPTQSNFNLSGLAGLISGHSPTASFGAQLLGLSSAQDQIIYGLLNSRTVLTNTINKYHLAAYYKVHPFEKLLKAFRSDLSFEPTNYGMIDISVINKNPELSAKIANYLVHIVDSVNIQINMEQAQNNEKFIGKRYLQNVKDLNNSEDSLYIFQKNTGVIAMPQQLEVEVKASAELEAQLVQKQLIVDLIKNQYGENSPQYVAAETQVNFLKAKVEQLKNSQQLTKNSNIFLAYKNIPKLILKYAKYYREVKLQSKIMEVLLPIYEQAKIDAKKNVPTLQIIDKAIPAKLKYGPKRSLIVAGVTLVFLFLFIIVAYMGERLLHTDQYHNPLEEKEARFFKKIKKFYKLKFD